MPARLLANLLAEPPGRSLRTALGAPVLVFVLALALYLLAWNGHYFSDGVHLRAMVQSSPAPYYNLLYVPLGWALHYGFGARIGLDVAGSLHLLSAVATAASAGLLTFALRRRNLSWGIALPWLGAFVLAPSIVWFGATIEVHALHLFGMTVATLLALSAARKPPKVALAMLAVAIALALSAHLTSVLLIPALILAASTREAGRGLALRPAPTLGVLLVIGVLTPLLLWLGGGGRMLFGFMDLFLGRLLGGKLYSAAELFEFTWSEAGMALGALWVSLLAALFAWRGDGAGVLFVRRLTLFLLAGLAPLLAIFPQGGVRERGGYFLVLAPAMVLLGSEATRRRPRVAAAVAVLSMVFAAVHTVERLHLPARPVATDWARDVADLVGPNGYVFTTTLPRLHALTKHRSGDYTIDVVREMELTPRRLRRGSVDKLMARSLVRPVSGIYLDLDLFGEDLETPASDLVAPFIEELLAKPLRLEFLPPEDPLLARVIFVPTPER